MDKISVIIPAYNAERYIERCIYSILNQTYKNFEVIVIDDGSTDNTFSICEKIKNDNNILLIRKKNQGSAAARNYGIKVATGDFIAFVDADDYINKEFLSTLLRYQKKYDADIVQCRFKINNDENIKETEISKINFELKSKQDVFIDFCKRKTYLNTVVLWNKLYKKELFSDLHIVEGKSVDDEYIILELIRRSKIFIDIDHKLYTYYQSSNSQMRSKFSLTKIIDGIDLFEYQMPIILEEVPKEYYGTYLYRICRGFLDYSFFMKKNSIEKEELIQKINRYIKKYMITVFRCKKVSIFEKLVLIIQLLFPGMMWRIKRGKV